MIISPVDSNPSELSLSKSSSKLNLISLGVPPIDAGMSYDGRVASSPPGYSEMRRPTTTITYTFSPQAHPGAPANSMILAPPSYVTLLRPPYYIAVNMNCFTPSSYITTVRRGSWDGEFVGDFEMGLTSAKKTSTVCIRGNEQPITELLESGYRLFRNLHSSWTWKITAHDKSINLLWDESPGPGPGILTCFLSKEKVATNILAKFIPPSHSRKQGRPSDSTRLEVTPQGHDYLDDIVISVLIVERIRTSPSVWPVTF